MGIIIAIIALSVIIFIHELGHFLVSKFFGVPVREFSIGMGKRIFSFIKGNTRYSLKILPLGGSCALVGEDISGSGDFTDNIGVIDKEKGTINYDGVIFDLEYVKKNNFSVISPVKKFLIALSGPLSNFILAFLLSMIIVMYVGYDKPIITDVVENGAASVASPYSLESGDEIIELKTKSDKMKITSYRDILFFMTVNNDELIKENEVLIVSFKRNGVKYDTILKPIFNEEENRVMMGISLSNGYMKANNFFDFIISSFNEFSFYIKTTIKSLKLLFKGRVSVNQVSGPVGTVAVMGTAISDAASAGFLVTLMTTFSIIVLISANLGVMNLLPIPALDGGRIVFAIIEMIIGRPLGEKIEGYANMVTMALLLIFMFYIMGLDVYKIFTGTLFK